MTVPFERLRQANLRVDEEYESNGAQNSSGDVLCKLMGVGSLGGFRKRKAATGSFAYIALESTNKEIDWIDVIDIENGIVTYYGDNRRPGHELHNTKQKGNAILRDCFQNLFEGKRESIPPFFYFVSAGGRNRRFIGLLVPGDAKASQEDQLVAIWRSKEVYRYQNYKARFTILDISEIDRRWLDDLVCGYGADSRYAPDVWKKWATTGVAKPLSSTRVIEYRNKNEQLPLSPEGDSILHIIYDYFIDKYCFEECAIRIVEMMDNNIHHCQHTRYIRDGGRDAIGQYRIGRITDGIDVEFALEAKCYKRDNEVGVKEISRLISRLRFRQFGVLVTTSFVGQQAYKEIKEDQHPVIIIAGVDIVNILYEAGYKTIDEVSNWLQQFRKEK